jgi:predicted nucleic acid-binding protein
VILDTNIVIDLIDPDSSPDVAAAVADLRNGQEMIINEIIFAELSGRTQSAHDLITMLKFAEISVARLSLEACHRAGVAFNAYRKSGAARTTILPDFLIGAHASILYCPLVTRDRKLFATYFPEIQIIDPLKDK